MVCDVCENVFLLDLNTTSNENSIVTCSKCNVKVHQLCYGVAEYAAEWLCDICKKSDEKACVLCPNTTGTDWVHVICGLFTPGVVVKNPTTNMQPMDLTNVAKKSYGLQCYICEKNGLYRPPGACVTCSAHKCKRNLHVTCGQRAGILKERKSAKGNLIFIAYCEEHLPREANMRISFSSVATVLNDRQKVNDKQKAKTANAKWIAAVSTRVCWLILIILQHKKCKI